MISPAVPQLLFLSDGSPTAPLGVETPGSVIVVIVDRQLTSGHLTGGQGGRARAQYSQPSGVGQELLQGSVAKLVYPQEVSLVTSSELIIVFLNLWNIEICYGGQVTDICTIVHVPSPRNEKLKITNKVWNLHWWWQGSVERHPVCRLAQQRRSRFDQIDSWNLQSSEYHWDFPPLVDSAELPVEGGKQVRGGKAIHQWGKGWMEQVELKPNTSGNNEVR